MRKFNITVNGKSYEVEVEEIGGVKAPARPAPVSAPPAAPTPAAAPAPAPAAPKAAPAVAGGETVTAPMPGKVLRVLKGEGTPVKNGDVVMILEAMKMENEITAPVDGTVQQVAAKEGTTVNPGDVLFVIG
ncbi:MAG: glutaconyl-CoA/methylmalonyl-CoA decarboxylase subunit gamma [Clostridia bacterium]|jgi:glutaconyl-CoA decarboxylase|nr:glutaconyl-CoA/methylmalonyl-CoA decarboxylase subunit gamma [Clostridia bacterium]